MPKQRDGLLNSWKEIANYLGRGVRTLQRWERDGLPVRRLGTGSRSPVIANASEIDHWLQKTASQRAKSVHPEQLLCTGALQESIVQARALREQMIALRNNRRHALADLMTTVAKLKEASLPPVSDSLVSVDSENKHDPETASTEGGTVAAWIRSQSSGS